VSRRVISMEGYDEAVRLYLSGKTCAQAAYIVGCKWNNVRDELKRRGIPARPLSHYKHRNQSAILVRPDSELRAILEAYQSGESMNTIGRRYRMAGPTVRSVLCHFGEPIRGRGGPKGRRAFRRDRDDAIRVLRAAGWTLDEIAAVVALGSRERVRQILEEEAVPA